MSWFLVLRDNPKSSHLCVGRLWPRGGTRAAFLDIERSKTHTFSGEWGKKKNATSEAKATQVSPLLGKRGSMVNEKGKKTTGRGSRPPRVRVVIGRRHSMKENSEEEGQSDRAKVTWEMACFFSRVIRDGKWHAGLSRWRPTYLTVSA